jgi:hypothetical protein
MRRRDFIQFAVTGVAGLGMSAIGGEAFGRLLPADRVRVRAELGNFFPPLELVRRVHRADDAETFFSMPSHEKEPNSTPTNSPRILDVAFRLPVTNRQENAGNLPDETQALVTRQIKLLLEKNFNYHVVKTNAASNAAFWYPYPGKANGNLVFCRLTVTKVPSEGSV